jgi:hypothetical protein
MQPFDRVLAEELSALRDRLLAGLGKRDPQRYWILENKLVDRIALKYPRPQTEIELMAMLPNRAKQTIEPYIKDFLMVIRDHNDNDSGFRLSEKEEKVETAPGEVQRVEVES